MTLRDDGPLGGLVRRKLIRELALGNQRQSSLAKKYGVSEQAVSKFKQRHADEIVAVAAAADDEFAGILIAQKAFRLGALQEIHEIAMTPQPKVTPAGKVAYDDEDKIITEVQLGEARQALKQAAEELGQLANRVTLTGQLDTMTTYKIMNVSDDDLT